MHNIKNNNNREASS